MQVFIGWSGERSQQAARKLYSWLKLVIPQVELWMSEFNIDSGAPWPAELTQALSESDTGILCLTPENLESGWLLFEAGALSHGFKRPVCPYLLCGLEERELHEPLARFQMRVANEDGTRALLQTINKLLAKPLSDEEIETAFQSQWPEFKHFLDSIPDVKLPTGKFIGPRGNPLIKELAVVGVISVENRDDLLHSLPPDEFYRQAKREIVVTGVSLYRTFDAHMALLHELLSDGKQLFAMMLHPDSEDVERLSKREKRNIRLDILSTLYTIKAENLVHYPGFHIKFYSKLPPSIGVMIDGDLCSVGSKPDDEAGQIRVQPNTLYKSGHRGLIIQLEKLPPVDDRPAGPFDYFAEDLRQIWAYGAESAPELLE